MTPTGELLKPNVFKTMYAGKVFIMDAANSRACRNAFEAFTESQVVVTEKVKNTCFRPDLTPGEIVRENGDTAVNTYWPIPTKRMAGDVTLFLDHLAKLCPIKRDADILLAYMAALVQHPGIKFQWCPFIQGVEGNGKTLLSRCVRYAIGERYTHQPKASELSSKFNDYMANNIFIQVEDIFIADGMVEVYEALKPMLTNEFQEIEPKGGRKLTKRVCANFIINSNHKDGLRKTRDNRTFAPFYTAQQSLADLERDGMGEEYFRTLYGWLDNGGYAMVNHYLRTYLIPDELNPATHSKRVPTTSCTEMAITQSRGRIDQEIIEAIESGRAGFRRGWVSSTKLNELLDMVRASGRIAHNKRKDLLAQLGYSQHPYLKEGRASRVVLPDGNQPKLYVTHDHPSLRITDPAALCKMYEDDQK